MMLRGDIFFKKDNGRGNGASLQWECCTLSATLPTLANEKTTFLENISTKDDAAKRYFSKRTTDGAGRCYALALLCHPPHASRNH